MPADAASLPHFVLNGAVRTARIGVRSGEYRAHVSDGSDAPVGCRKSLMPHGHRRI